MCTSHRIRNEVVEQLLMEDLKRIKIYYNCIGAIEMEPNVKMQSS